jgi:hypothetical protein
MNIGSTHLRGISVELDRLNTSFVPVPDYVQRDLNNVVSLQGDELPGSATFDRQAPSYQFGYRE